MTRRRPEQLPDVQPAAGWLREPQRFPVRIMLMPTDDGKETLAYGTERRPGQCHDLHRPGKSILNPIGRLWIRLVALLSYLR